MKRIFSVLIALLLIAGIMSGCGSNGTTDDGRLSIVTTMFPQYDWVCEILGDRADDVQVTLLMDNGVDMHSYQPTAEDIITISSCDMIIFTGGQSDIWIEEILEDEDITAINLLETLGDDVKCNAVIEGMQDDGHNHDDHDHDHDAADYDEHVWLSVKNAKTICQVIADKLSQIDIEHKDEYAANADRYIEKLDVLDGQYAEAVDNATQKTLLFADRFPFRYLTDDYGLSYYAAFSGCSSETDASFETISFLAGKVDELGLSVVLTIEGSDKKIAETVIQSTEKKDAQILSLDSMQSVAGTSEDISYISIMEKNLESLKQALK